MSETQEESLQKIPVLGALIRISQRIKLPGLNGLSLYELLKTYIIGLGRGAFSFRASAIAFSFFMAIFPFILFVLNLLPFIKIRNFQTEFLLFINEFLPPQTADVFVPIIIDITNNPRGNLLSFTLILAIFLMSNGVNAIFSSFNNSYYLTQRRGFIRQYLMSVLISVFLVFILFFVVIAFLIGQYFIIILHENAESLQSINLIVILRYFLFALVIYVSIALLYYFGTKESKSYSFFSLGASITTGLYIITTFLFGLYINNFSNYNELYGSIGAILIMMSYIWINSNLLLLGFELNVTINTLRKNNRSN